MSLPTNSKENRRRSKHSRLKTSQPYESASQKVLEENVATSTQYDPAAPGLTDELPHKFTESRNVKSGWLTGSKRNTSRGHTHYHYDHDKPRGRLYFKGECIHSQTELGYP